MQAIRLHAYLQNNIGDDLMVKILLEKYPNYVFFYDRTSTINKTLMTYPNFLHHEKIYKKYGRLNHICNIILPRKFNNIVFKKVFDKIKKSCCCSVYIGGTIFYSRPHETPEQHIVKEMRRVDPSPMFVIGANFNSKETDEYIKAYYDFFRKLGGVSFRDKTSYDLFKNLSNVQYASDVVFNLDTGDINKTVETELNPTVLISVVDCNNKANKSKYTDDYENAIVKVCCDAVSRGLTPILTSFCEIERDAVAVKRIMNNLPRDVKDKTLCYQYNDDIEELLEHISKSKCIVATRFHAMILAMIYKKPFYAISYDIKLKNVLDDMNFDNYCDITDIKALLNSSVFDNMSTLCDVKVYAEDAKRHFSQLDTYLDSINKE